MNKSERYLKWLLIDWLAKYGAVIDWLKKYGGTIINQDATIILRQTIITTFTSCVTVQPVGYIYTGEAIIGRLWYTSFAPLSTIFFCC